MRARRAERASVCTLPKTIWPDQSSRSAFTTEAGRPAIRPIVARFCSISSSVCCSTRKREPGFAAASSQMKNPATAVLPAPTGSATSVLPCAAVLARAASTAARW